MNKILCVDDAPDMLKLLVRMLEMRGYEVNQASNGLEAVKKAETWQPNLIITDIIMPYMNGLDAIVALRHNPQTADIPIIVFTASVDEEEAQKALQLGADEHMPKPFDSAILDKLLQRFLGPNASLQNLEQTRQNSIKEAASKILLAQKMNLAYQLDLYRTSPDLAATINYYTSLTRDMIHGLRNRFGILQSYLPQAKYCTQLLEGLAFLHLKPSLAQEFFDGTAVEITTKELMVFNANRYKINITGYQNGDKEPGITLKGWLDSELLSLGLWLFFQGISGGIPNIRDKSDTLTSKQLIQIYDTRIDNSQLGLGLYLSLPSYSTSNLLKLDDPNCMLQGNTAAIGLMLLKKAVFLNGGTLRLNRQGEMQIKIPSTLVRDESLEETELQISQMSAELPSTTEPYERYKPQIQNLTLGFIAAMDRELQCMLVDAPHDEYLRANQKFLDIVLRNCTYARLLLENLRWLGTGTELPPEVVDLATVTESIRVVLRGRIRERATDDVEGLVEVHQEIPADLPPIYGNQMAVQQILLNLIVNALEAMPQDGLLKLQAFENETEICFEISDTGQGIPAQKLGSIFDLSFTTKQAKNYGTGLYIVKALVNRLNGRIEVESTPDEGSTFRLYFLSASN